MRARPRQANIDRIVAIITEARTLYAVPGEGLYLFNTFTAVDAMLAPLIFCFQTYRVSREDWSDAAKEYYETMLEDEAMQAWKTAACNETSEIAKYDALSLSRGTAV